MMANTLSPELKAKILATFNSLNQGLVEREQILKVALLTMLAGENLLLVGPPGTAKSLIARRVAQALTPIDQTHGYFEYLLTKFSTPEEIFGPLSIAALKNDCVKRNTVGYLPSVRIAFLDEIFKASSSILNALLTILNERLYHNGAEPQKVPLQALIAASNELPTGQDELNALYDRFLLRVFVDYVSLDNLPQLFAKTSEPTITAFTEDELQAIKQAAQAVTIPTEIVQAIQQIWQKHHEMFKEDRREQLSDRRLKKLIHLLNVAAATNGRTEVNLSDVLLLKDCLWNHPDNTLKVRELIFEVLRSFSYSIVSSADDVSAFLQGHSISAHEDEDNYIFGNTASNAKQISPKTVIKGYKGSGTKTDPILIQDFHDIAGLEREDVGQKGYYFKQTADIDCSTLTTWPIINFQGHYDGGGYCVVYDGFNCSLFKQIYSQSKITNLCVQGLMLATNVNSSEIIACTAINGSLIEAAINSTITMCDAEQHLIVNSVTKQSVISQCQSGYPLVGDMAIDSEIRNCIVMLDCARAKDRAQHGGVAYELRTSVVESCFVAGQLTYSYYYYAFSGFTDECKSSTIRYCALGALQLHSRATLPDRIVRAKDNSSVLQDNIAIDTHNGTSDAQGKDGKSVSAASFTQHYFENHLGWDFDKIWQWNSSLNRPQLQSVGVGATVNHTVATQPNTDDLLTQQIRHNIWL